MTEIDPAYHGEALLLRWGESSANGRTVTFQIDGEGDHSFKPFSAGKNGTRFAIVAVPIADNDEPRTKAVDPMVRDAGILCGDARFQRFVMERVDATVATEPHMPNEDEAAGYVREYCGIESRKELATNQEARAKWTELRRDFNVWMAT